MLTGDVRLGHSELPIAESWYDKAALDDRMGVTGDKINDDRRGRAADHRGEQ